MRRCARTVAAVLTSSVLLLACSDDGGTGDADADADTPTQGDRDPGVCTGDDEVVTEATYEEQGNDPQGATEDQEACTTGNDGGDGEVDSGGTPGAGSP